MGIYIYRVNNRVSPILTHAKTFYLESGVLREDIQILSFRVQVCTDVGFVNP